MAQLPRELVDGHHGRAIELGLYATNMPTEVGGRGCTTLQQVLVQEQAGRVTNALGWVLAHAAGLVARGRHADQRERWLLPTVRGETRGVLRDHRGGAPGSDVADLTATARARRRRLRPRRREVARHVLQRGRLRVLPGHAATARTPASTPCSSSTCPRPGCGWCAPRRTPTPSPTHHPIVAFEGVRVPATHLVGARGRRDDLRLRVVPLRAADGRGPLPRRRRAARRGGHRVRAAADRRRGAADRPPARRRRCSPTA